MRLGRSDAARCLNALVETHVSGSRHGAPGFCLGFADVVGVEAVLDREGVALGGLQVGLDHLLDELGEGGTGGPTEDVLGLGGIAEEGFDLGGAEVAGIDGDDGVAILVDGFLVHALHRTR